MMLPGTGARILFVCHSADWIGPSHSLMLLLRHLPARFEPAVLMPGQGALSELLDREHIPWYSLPRLDIRSVSAMMRLVRRERFDLVYGNNSSGGSRNALLAAKLAGVPFICHVREMGWGKGWKRWGYLRVANAVITISEACAASTRKFVPEKRLHVIHNGVDLTPSRLAEPGRGVTDGSPDAARNGPTLVAVGHICARKGTVALVRAMSRVLEQLPAARLTLVGALDREPEYVEEVRSLIRERGMEGRVDLAGFHQDVSPFLSGADIFVHTAISEPHGRSVIEAMAAGLPVVAFGVDGVAESVQHGVTGILVEQGDVRALGDAIVRIARDDRLRRELAAAGRRRATQVFSAAATADKVVGVIDRVLAGRRRRAARAPKREPNRSFPVSK